jgi:hypothetical protein
MEAQQYIVSTLQHTNGLPGIHKLTEGPPSLPLRHDSAELITAYSAVRLSSYHSRRTELVPIHVPEREEADSGT